MQPIQFWNSLSQNFTDIIVTIIIIYSEIFIAIRGNGKRKSLVHTRGFKTVSKLINIHHSFAKALSYRKAHMFENGENTLNAKS